jgi:hypothetical protein
LVFALIWAIVWLPIGVALAYYADSRPAAPSDIIGRPVSIPVFATAWTAWGAISGGVFAVVLGWAERRRTIEALSIVRTALWGALGASALPVILLGVDMLSTPAGLRGYGWRFPFVVIGVSAALGAGCAAATLGLARRPTG